MESCLVISHRPMQAYLSSDHLVINPHETLAVIISGCVLLALLEHRSRFLALNALLKIRIAGVSSALPKRVTPTAAESRSSFEEILTDLEEPLVLTTTRDKVDVRNVETPKLVQHGKKGKPKGKKGGTGDSKKEKENAEPHRKKEEEEERLKKWNDDWEKKLKAQEMLDDVPCCSAQGLFLKPKTQSNIWIKVSKDKTTQDVQMAFMHVPVPRPKPPPLPKLVTKIAHDETAEAEPPKTAKKKGKGKGKGKKK